MAKVPSGQRLVGDYIKAVNAMALPRKRCRTSGFDSIRDGAMYRPMRQSNNNARAYRLNSIAAPRLALVPSKVAYLQPQLSARGNL